MFTKVRVAREESWLFRSFKVAQALPVNLNRQPWVKEGRCLALQFLA